MRVLQVSKFLRHVGGVETYIDSVSRYLRDLGHEVGFFGMDLPHDREAIYGGAQFRAFSPPRTFSGSRKDMAISGASAVYSAAVQRDLEAAIQAFKPDVIHFHGTCYQLTSSVFRAATNCRVPFMITAHEYKLICANQRLWDDASAAECYACVDKSALVKAGNILARNCVKGSRVASVIASVEQVVSSVVLSRSKFLIHAPSQYMKDLLIADGHDEQKVVYKDLAWEPWRPVGTVMRRDVLQYIGRLSVEKGIDRLLLAWKRIEDRNDVIRLRVAGEGAERTRLETLANDLGLGRVVFTGVYTRPELDAIMSDVFATVHPSIWAENSPFTVRESLSRGVPAIVSNRGGLPEMIDGDSGVVVDPHDSNDVAQKVLAVHSRRLVGSAALECSVNDRATSPEEHGAWLLATYQRLADDD